MYIVKYVLLLFFICKLNAQTSDFKYINFQKADNIALKYKGEKLNNLPDLAHKLTSNLTTDVERFRAIFKWVCTNVSNDYKLYSKNKRKRRRLKGDSVQLKQWNTKFRKLAFKKLRTNRRTICTGYAYLIKKLANLANIKCGIVHGFARTSTINVEELNAPNHSWNAVLLNNKWYLCDPTWASGIPNPSSNLFQFKFNDGFFLSNPEIFAVNHFPANNKWLLLESEKPTFKTFLEAPIIYGDAYVYFNSHEVPQKMHTTIKKNENVTFKFKLRKPINKDDIYFVIDVNSYNIEKHPETISIENQEVTLTYKFQATGFFDVHLYIKENLISTYTFQVKR